jgi:hypothetical protein
LRTNDSRCYGGQQNETTAMRTRAFRRYQTSRHQWRRLSEDRNQHYRDLDCRCWTDPKTIARFKEQPQLCSCWGCGNQRRAWGRKNPTVQERRFLCDPADLP